jgi:hypothetical protein
VVGGLIAAGGVGSLVFPRRQDPAAGGGALVAPEARTPRGR